MPTAILSTENESDFKLIIELSKKLNLNTKILNDDEDKEFYKLSESSFDDWLVKEEEEAWKDL